MIVRQSASVFRVLAWQWKSLAFFLVSSSAAYVLFRVVKANGETLPEWIALPTLPIAVVGGALGIFVSFRTNSAYDRWWEGRKLWGRLINTSRHLSSQLKAYVLPLDAEVANAAVIRQAAYVDTLRIGLRQQSLVDDPDLNRLLGKEAVEALAKESNPTHALLQMHMDAFTALTRRDENALAALRMQDLDESVRHLLDIQGGCERIKKTPLPRGYGYFAERLIQLYAILLPLAIVEQMGWTTIPISIIVCLSFTLISEAGRVLEDPFNMFYNSLPLTQMSRMIETNIRQRFGHSDMPPIPGPQNGVLM